MVALNLDDAFFDRTAGKPHITLSFLPINARVAASIASPLINVTPLPFLPLVSRETRTLPLPGGDVCLRQVHWLTGLPQPGQILPCSVE